MPTSYYASVQFVCRPEVVDDPPGKADILTAQLADLQPEGRHADVAVDDPYARMLSGIRGIRLAALLVEAKFQSDDKPTEHRTHVSDQLEQRRAPADIEAAAQHGRRLTQTGRATLPRRPGMTTAVGAASSAEPGLSPLARRRTSSTRAGREPDDSARVGGQPASGAITVVVRMTVPVPTRT